MITSVSPRPQDYHGRPSVTGKLKAQEAIVCDAWKRYYRLLISNKLEDKIPHELLEVYHLEDEIERLKSARDGSSRISMITINPPDQYNWNDLEGVVDKILGYKNFIIDPEVAYEQRSDDPANPHGYHVHIACKLTKSKAEVIKRCYSAYQQCKLLGSPSVINVNMNSPNAIEYVNGHKSSSSKLQKVKVDKAIKDRTEGSLKSRYSNL